MILFIVDRMAPTICGHGIILDYRDLAGQIASGPVRADDEVVALPSGRTTQGASSGTCKRLAPRRSRP
jgi:sulfate adenylyltransferase subunit 1 (EFTu-like GTPase family)